MFMVVDLIMIELALFSKADLQVKIAEEQSRNDGIRGIVVSMDNGDGVFILSLCECCFTTCEGMCQCNVQKDLSYT